MTTTTPAIPFLPNYRMTEVIDEDSYTIMYRATRDHDGLAVIVKTLKQEKPDPKRIARLMHEYQITKELNLPQVVRAYDLERHQGNVALILEDFGGRSLKEELASGPLALDVLLTMAIALAEALDGLHRQRIVHKDIKPQNVIVNAQTGEVKLTDFGIASQLSSENQRMGVPQLLEGTLAYMSPEQTGRMNRALDYRSDFYSLGVTLYEMLTATLPFQSQDAMELVHSHIARRPTPPHELLPSIPQPVSDIVMKLLAKTAEERYQHAHGLKADLERCLREWHAMGKIEPFELGRRDLADSFRIPQKLYGREAEIQQLMQAFIGVSAGSSGLVLVSGYSGIGKTALVHEIHKPVTAERGFFISGKFDQLKRSTPHAAVIQAFEELIHQLLQNEEQIGRWRAALQQALGANAQLIIDVIPQVEQLIGPQPAVPQLGPTESQNRFHMVLRHFIGVFAREEHPLVIFLDDLQWADLASLKLIQQLLADQELGHLLLIGAYRDNEVSPRHPLQLLLDEIEKSGAPLQRIVLQPLQLKDVNQLLADALSSDRRTTRELAELVHQKAGGNPFFLQQFLKSLYEEKLLVFDVGEGCWQWDTRRIHETDVTDNVVTLVVNKIQKLDPATQRVLMLAACIGFQFDLQLLTTLYEQSPASTAGVLWEAIQEGLIIPLDADYKLLQGSDAATLEALASSAFNVRYRFLHDRVHQAADTLLSDEEKQQIHLRIGRLMVEALEDSASQRVEDQIFTMVNHLNVSAALITEQGERDKLAVLNFTAGQRAKASAAYESAVGYLRTGVGLLSEDIWERHYDLALMLWQERVACEYLVGEFETAEALFNTFMEHARFNVDKVEMYITRIGLYASLGLFVEGVAVGLEALRLLGISFPEREEERTQLIGQAFGEVQENLAGRSPEDLLELPAMSDKEKQAAMRLLMALVPLAFNVSPTLLALITLAMVNLSLTHGNTRISAYAYVMYGLLLAMQEQYAPAHAFGRLAIELNEKFDNSDLRGKIFHVFGQFIEPWRGTITSGASYLRQAYLDSLEIGDYIYAGFACWIHCSYRFSKGDELHDVFKEAERYLAFARQAKHEMVAMGLQLIQHTIMALQGRTTGLLSLSTTMLDEQQFLSTLKEKQFLAIINQYYINKLYLALLFEEYDLALDLLAEAERSRDGLRGTALVADMAFYAALLHAQRYPHLAPEAQAECWKELGGLQQQLQTWATNAPENYEHQRLLVAAELARLQGKESEATNLYDAAIETAQQHGFTHHEALGNELAGRFYHARGKEKIARVYLLDAHYAYGKRGATAKAHALQEQYSSLLGRHIGARDGTTAARATTASTTSQERTDLLDMMTVMKAAQVISGEIRLDALLGRLMEIVLQNAGAQTGMLILNRNGELILEASVSVDSELSLQRISQPLDQSQNLALTVVRHVASQLAPVVINDARQQDAFSSDPYIIAAQPRSLLCLPLIHQGHLTGLLYLENNLAVDVFTPSRLELLQLLSSQAAIAIENALLYQNLQTMSDQLRGTNRALEEQNQTLERRVEERTIELREANARLQLELLERKRMEEERVQLQEEIIRAQAQTLAELSTPLIPITDSVLVMPLIGAMDSARAQQVLETLLHGVQANRGRLVIIDITGVPVVDTAVASTLMRAAQALRLLGAQTVITGIRPEVAQTIVQLGLDLTSITTTGSLQNGIAYALHQSGHDPLDGRNGALPLGR